MGRSRIRGARASRDRPIAVSGGVTSGVGPATHELTQSHGSGMHGWSAKALLVSTVMLVAAHGTQSQPASVTASDAPVLFICEHGTVKSLMAKLLFDQYAAAAGLSVRSISRGSAADTAVPAWMQARLISDGFTLGAWKPAALSAADLRGARFVASFDVPAAVSDGAVAPRVQWDSLPAASENYAASRDAIAARVRGLVDSLVAHAHTVDWTAIDAAMGRAGVVQPGDVHRYNFPRSDLSVTVTSANGDVRLRPALALGGWIAMHAMGGADSVMAMGDLVLTENEVAPVISALQAGGVGQSALHHHLLHESPRVLYMHVHVTGSAQSIARTIHSAIALTGAPAVTKPAPTAVAAPIDLDTAGVARALGRAGRVNGGVYQVSVPRAESIRDGAMVIPPAMGLGTVINFQPTGAGKAAITGDFVMIAPEVNPVIRALRAAGIEVTSLHNHMLTDEPRLFFMHFWANDDAVGLARGLRTALELTNSVRTAP